MNFSEDLWKSITPLYRKILDLPFNKELSDGTLSEDRFAFYMKQDALYLADFSRALAVAGVKSPDAGTLKQFLDFADGAVVVERALHEGFLKKFDTYVDVGKSPTCFNYTHFLLTTAFMEDYPVVMASLLPCFWIYREVGLHIYDIAAEKNPYQDWIDTYAGKDFSDSVNLALELTDRAAGESSQAVRDRMKEAFIFSTKLEWMFWDSAYKMEEWPV